MSDKFYQELSDCCDKHNVTLGASGELGLIIERRIKELEKQLEKNESYFCSICESLNIDHKSKLVDMLVAIDELANSVPNGEIKKIIHVVENCAIDGFNQETLDIKLEIVDGFLKLLKSLIKKEGK